MSKKPTEINPVRADRVKTILERENVTQQRLAELIFQTQQNISRIMQKKQPLTEETAKAIIAACPEYRIEWLLGYDDIMTQTDEIRVLINNKVDAAEAIHQLIFLTAAEICKRENLPPPEIPILEYLELQDHLLDYTELILYDYLKNRDKSRFWKRFDNHTQY